MISAKTKGVQRMVGPGMKGQKAKADQSTVTCTHVWYK